MLKRIHVVQEKDRSSKGSVCQENKVALWATEQSSKNETGKILRMECDNVRSGNRMKGGQKLF